MIRPEPSSRHPLVVLFLLIVGLNGAGYLLGFPAPGSVVQEVPEWGIILWSWALAGGAGITLAGLALQPHDRYLVRGVQFELLGMSLLGPSAIMYATVVISAAGWSAGLPAAFAAGFGAACIYRMYTLIRQIRTAQKAAAESDGAPADGRR